MDGQAETRDRMARIFFQQGRLDSVLSAYQSALEIYVVHGHPRGRAVQSSKIGQVLQKQGRLDEAIKSHREALSLYREFDLYAEGATQLDYIGHLYFRQSKIDEALASFENALHVFTQASNRQGEAAQLSNIGNIYFDHASPENSVQHAFSENDIIGLGISIIDNDVGTDNNTDRRFAAWRMGGARCGNGDGKCITDFILALSAHRVGAGRPVRQAGRGAFVDQALARSAQFANDGLRRNHTRRALPRLFRRFCGRMDGTGWAEMTEEAREIYAVRGEIYRKVGVAR